jgi:hypothetical protein
VGGKGEAGEGNWTRTCLNSGKITLMVQQLRVHTKRVMEILPCHILAVLEARWAFDTLRHLDRAAPERQDGVVERVPRHVRDLIGLKEGLKVIGEFRAAEEREDATTQLRISVMTS